MQKEIALAKDDQSRSIAQALFQKKLEADFKKQQARNRETPTPLKSLMMSDESSVDSESDYEDQSPRHQPAKPKPSSEDVWKARGSKLIQDHIQRQRT